MKAGLLDPASFELCECPESAVGWLRRFHARAKALIAYDTSHVDMSGGYYVTDAATITIYGDDFEVDGSPVAFGDLQANAGQAIGQLTGHLASGDVADDYFDISGTGKIILVQACIDGDGDGYGRFSSPLCPANPVLDCDDTDGDIYPGSPEVCDGKDNDCNGQTDEVGLCGEPVPVSSPYGFVGLALLLLAAGSMMGSRVAHRG